jgi:hypothetical protein
MHAVPTSLMLCFSCLSVLSIFVSPFLYIYSNICILSLLFCVYSVLSPPSSLSVVTTHFLIRYFLPCPPSQCLPYCLLLPSNLTIALLLYLFINPVPSYVLNALSFFFVYYRPLLSCLPTFLVTFLPV